MTRWSSTALRVLAIALGLIFIVFPFYILFKTGSTDMWIQPLMGVLFLLYGLVGNNGLKKINGLSSFTDKIGKE